MPNQLLVNLPWNSTLIFFIYIHAALAMTLLFIQYEVLIYFWSRLMCLINNDTLNDMTDVQKHKRFSTFDLGDIIYKEFLICRIHICWHVFTLIQEKCFSKNTPYMYIATKNTVQQYNAHICTYTHVCYKTKLAGVLQNKSTITRHAHGKIMNFIRGSHPQNNLTATHRQHLPNFKYTWCQSTCTYTCRSSNGVSLMNNTIWQFRQIIYGY